MQDSIFTKIINGEIPCHKIYEDEYTFAFLDIYPSCEGHTLVVHKVPTEFIWDLTDEQYGQLLRTVKKLALHFRKVSGKHYVKMDVIGTDVPHNHIHLKPFAVPSETHKADRTKIEPDHASLARIAERFRLDD